MAAREHTNQEIQSLVKDLESLLGGQMASAALIGCGARAIPPLRSYLLQGKPRGIYQPRQLAVETLAELGAKEVLLEFLETPSEIKDAVVRFGEEAVRSTAARELARFPTEDVFERLQKVALDNLLPGLVETFGTFGRTETMPYLLWALGDGICRASAEEAIRKLGDTALPFLIDAVDKPHPSKEEESPSSLQRRRWALRILSDLRASEGDWSKLIHLLEENDPDVVITACRIGLELASLPDKWRAVRRLIEMLPRADWFLRTEARAALADHFDVAQEAVEDEIARRSSSSAKEQAMDVVLRMLVNLRSQVAEAGIEVNGHEHRGNTTKSLK
jgi:HEAT repeat protein